LNTSSFALSDFDLYMKSLTAAVKSANWTW
jgi:hypothetical protein